MSPRWWSRRDRLVVVAAALVPLAVCAVLAPFRRTVPNTVAALVLVVAVVAVAAYGHRVAGVVASISAGLWFDFFLEAPYHRFVIAGRRDVEVFVLLIVVGLAVSELAVRGRRSRLLAATDERYLDAIRTTGELAGPGHSRQELTGHVCAQLTDLLGLTACRFEADRFGGMPRLEPDGRLRGTDGNWDIDQYGLPDREFEMIAAAGDQVCGRFVLRPRAGVVPEPAARKCAIVVVGQAATALLARAQRV